MSSYLYDLKDKVIETSEQMIKVVEEGATILMGIATQATDTNDIPESNDSMDDLVLGEEEDIVGMKSPLDGITEGVLGDILNKQVSPQSFSDSVNAFRSAITWNEPFIIGLVSFHILALFTTLYVTKRGGVSSGMVLLVFLAGIVRSAEYLNKYGANNWEQFATQNYFDENGVFISIMLCAPLLLTALIMLISYLREAARLLVQVKRQELKEKYKKNKKSNNGSKNKKKGSKKED